MVFLAAIVIAASEKEEPVFSDIKLELSFEKAPRFRTAVNETGNNKFLDSEEYLVVKATYIPGVRKKPIGTTKTPQVWLRNNKKIMLGKLEAKRWLDNVRMDVLVAYPDQLSRKGKRQTTYGLFEGKTNFWSIPIDGKKHTATMFVPPHLLARYINQPVENQRQQRMHYRYSPKDFFVEVIFRTANGEILGARYYNNPYSASMPSDQVQLECEKFFRKIEDSATRDKSIVRNAVLPRNRSPWAFINPECYDLITPGSGTAQ